MNNRTLLFVLLIAASILVLFASASYVCAGRCFTMTATTVEPWTKDPGNDGRCPDGYRPRTHDFEKQCFRCPEEHRYGYVNFDWTCFKCPDGYSLRTHQGEDKCAKCPK